MAKKKNTFSPQQARQKAAEKAKKAQKSDRIWTIILIVFCSVMLVAAIYAVLPERTPETPEPVLQDPPVFDELGENQYYFATLKINTYNEIKIQLDHKEAPITVDHFVKLAREKYYEGKTFHRIMKDFMMQGGGTMIPGNEAESVVGEFRANGYTNNIAHKRGVISMARTDDYNSATSQFFIVQKDSAHLNGKYAAFGYVVEGMEIVDAICNTASPTDDNGSIALFDQPIIDYITISIETVS